MKTTVVCFSVRVQGLLLIALAPHVAIAGSITGAVGSDYMDPCAVPTGSTGSCTPSLSAVYLERCLANFEGLKGRPGWNPDSCTSGGCQGWKITTRSKVLVTDYQPTSFSEPYQSQYCTNKRLHILGDLRPGTATTLPFKHVCQNASGQVSVLGSGGTAVLVNSIFMNTPNINSISLPSYTVQDPFFGPVSKKINYRRVYVRAADPNGVFAIPESNILEKYLYSLSLKDAVCTWRKFCNPTAPGLKTGVSTAGEALLPGAKSFDKDHPIARLCQLEPKWHSSNAAVSCAISQSGGIDALCSTPDPLHKNPPVGFP